MQAKCKPLSPEFHALEKCQVAGCLTVTVLSKPFSNESALPDFLPHAAALMSSSTSRKCGCLQSSSHSNSTISWVTIVAPACARRFMAAA